MQPFWKRLFGKASPREAEKTDRDRPEIGHTFPTRPDRKGYPNTYPSGTEQETDGQPPDIFEPALRQFGRAFRQGDPVFSEVETTRRWVTARRQVLAHLLRQVSRSPWSEHLVLRGSLLLQAWLGDAAREPGDIDWVFYPETIGIENTLSQELFEAFYQMAADLPQAGEAVIEVDKITVDDIWTYERADGRRIVFPWKAAGLPPGSVQMDVVFGEKLWGQPVPVALPVISEGDSLSVLAASKEVSLAWKLLWLETDCYPQGKDLYDATLLAEQTNLPLDLLLQVLRSGDWRPEGSLAYQEPEMKPDFALKWEVDWDNFKREYPWVEGEAADWQERLTKALFRHWNGDV